MGACGCGDFHGDFQFPGPDEITYVLCVYPGCSHCDTPAGIVLYAMDDDDCTQWDVASIPVLDVRDVGTLIAVVHPQKIMESVSEGVEAYLEEALGDEFRTAVFKSIGENKKLAKQ